MTAVSRLRDLPSCCAARARDRRTSGQGQSGESQGAPIRRTFRRAHPVARPITAAE